jgi:hypothetical protein
MTIRPNRRSSLTRGVLLALGVVALASAGCSNKQAGEDGKATTTAADESEGGSGNEIGETGEPTTSDGDASGPFVTLPDGGAVHTCDPALQDCPEGEKCTGYVVQPGYCCVDANKCVPVIGNGQLGDPCVRTVDNDDCAVGLFCMTKTSGSTGDGVCMAFCDAGTQNCHEAGLPDAKCVAFNDGTLPLCQDDCDPITQDCNTPMGCYGVGVQGFVCSVPGYEDGEGNDGDACFTIQSCKPGLGCIAASALDDCQAARCCTPYCDLTEPDPCIEPEQCIPYFEPGTAPPNYMHVGLCAIPD